MPWMPKDTRSIRASIKPRSSLCWWPPFRRSRPALRRWRHRIVDRHVVRYPFPLGERIMNAAVFKVLDWTERRIARLRGKGYGRSEEHTSELQSLMRISYAVFCLKKNKKHTQVSHHDTNLSTYKY